MFWRWRNLSRDHSVEVGGRLFIKTQYSVTFNQSRDTSMWCKCISQFEQIHIAIWTNTFCILDKYTIFSRRSTAFTFQARLILCSRHGTGHYSGERGNPVSDHGGKVPAVPKTKIALSPQIYGISSYRRWYKMGIKCSRIKDPERSKKSLAFRFHFRNVWKLISEMIGAWRRQVLGLQVFPIIKSLYVWKVPFMLGDPIRDLIRDPIREPIRDLIQAPTWDPIRDSILDPIRDLIRDQIWDSQSDFCSVVVVAVAS